MNWIRSLFLTIIVCYGIYTPLLCADDSTLEYQIKAGYLFNITKFVTWSNDTSQTFNLCLLGDDPFGSLIDPIEERTASDKPIKLFRITQLNAKQQCHILYFNKNSSENFNVDDPAIHELENTLIVGEGDFFADKVGMISFISREGKIKLKISLRNLKTSGLHVSAKLLEVAESTSKEEDNEK